MAAEQPAEPVRLATIPRGPTAELRIELCEFKGSKFLNARQWEKWTTDGTWHPSRRGITFKLRELAIVIESLKSAAALTAGAVPSGLPEGQSE